MEERQAIITKVIKLQALGISERKLGNTGAAITIETKVQDLISKYSITKIELGIEPKTSTNQNQRAYTQYTNPYTKEFNNDSLEDLLEQFRKFREDLEREEKNRSQKNQSYYTWRDKEPESEKVFRYKTEFECKKDPSEKLQRMCDYCSVELETFDAHVQKVSWFGSTKYTVVFSVTGKLPNLTNFKQYFQKNIDGFE